MHEMPTACIVHLAESADFKDGASNKLGGDFDRLVLLIAKRHHTANR